MKYAVSLRKGYCQWLVHIWRRLDDKADGNLSTVMKDRFDNVADAHAAIDRIIWKAD